MTTVFFDVLGFPPCAMASAIAPIPETGVAAG
jgi:hypothetical protein